MNYRHKIWEDIQHLEGTAKTTKEIETAVRACFKKYNLVSASRDYPMPDGSKFPGYICASVNDEECHGIPNNIPINWDTDVVNIDICFRRPDGLYEDNCKSWGTQNISYLSKLLTQNIVSRAHLLSSHHDIAMYAHQWCKSHGVKLMTTFGGHYIGYKLHIGFIGYDIGYITDKKLYDIPEGATGFTIEPIIQDINTGQYAQTEIQLDIINRS